MKGKRAVLLCAAILILTGSAVYASKIHEIKFTNKIETGSVDVQIRSACNNRYHKTFLPNQEVSYTPTVTNLRAEGYIRLKAEISSADTSAHPVTINDIYGLNEDWVRKGEYFYCRKPLASGESSEVFKGFTVPEEWTQEDAGTIEIKLTADVIQSGNFVPDFDALMPWGDITIQHAKSEDNIDYGMAKASNYHISILEYEEVGLQTETSDLFRNFGCFMAGETYEDELKIKNSSRAPVKVYFKTENEEDILTDKMQLQIKMDERLIYTGDLTSTSVGQYQELVSIGVGETKTMDFYVSLPEDAGNEYSVMSDQVVWKFKVQEESHPYQTGDRFRPGLYMWICIGAGGVMVVSMAAEKRRKRCRKKSSE